MIDVKARSQAKANVITLTETLIIWHVTETDFNFFMVVYIAGETIKYGT